MNRVHDPPYLLLGKTTWAGGVDYAFGWLTIKESADRNY
jgi:hypothetical protein